MWNETNNLHFINKFLPPGASILCIEEPNRRSAVVSADFDGDDIHEIAAAYRWNNRNGIVILKWFDGYWYPISYIKGSGYGITYFNAVPITGKPTYDLVIGWQHGAIYSQLDIQEWSENGFTSLLGNDVYYSEIEVANIPTKDEIDRKYEIALWSHDTGNAYVIEVYQWDGKGLKPFPQAYPYYFKKVADYYKKQVARLPDAAFYWYYLADAQFKTEQYHDALKSIETAINLRADYPSYSALLQLKELILSNLRKDLFLYPAALRTVDGTKWGYINSYGVFVIKPQYDNAMGFQNNGLAIIEKDGLSGVIDRNGRFRVPLKYYSINPFSEGRATVIDDSGFHVIDENGKIMTSKAYSYIGGYQNGRAVFYNVDNQESTLYGYLDKQGKEVIHAQYKSANDFADNQALVMIQDNQFALIGLNGEKLHSYQFAFVNNPGNGLLPFQPDANSKYGYINIDGNIILQPKYSMALPFKDQRAIVNTSDDFNNQFGLIDKQGNFVLSPIYNDISNIGDNRVAVGKAIDPEQPYIGSIYAIADMASGNILTPFSYSNVLTYNKGYVSVSDGSKTFFLDKEGKIAKSLPIVEGVGTLSFEGDLIQANVDQRIFYLDRNGKIIWRQNTLIPLNNQYKIIEEKYHPNKNYLVYYPHITGFKNDGIEKNVNEQLKELSQVKPVSDNLDYSYSGDFSVAFFKKSLLVLQLNGYQFYFGAAHGMPMQMYPHIDLISGRFYELKDLFKSDSDYVKILSDIIALQIKNDPQYSYIFPDEYKGIAPDQPFFVKEDALYIYFNVYEIGPYAVGFPTFRIPYTEIKSIINSEGSFWQAFH